MTFKRVVNVIEVLTLVVAIAFVVALFANEPVVAAAPRPRVDPATTSTSPTAPVATARTARAGSGRSSPAARS